MLPRFTLGRLGRQLLQERIHLALRAAPLVGDELQLRYEGGNPCGYGIGDAGGHGQVRLSQGLEYGVRREPSNAVRL